VGVTKTLIKLKLGLKIKVKEAVPNCLISKETLVKEGPESESISEAKSIVVSGDERSNATASSPVIKVYGSTGVEANSDALKVGMTETELILESTTTEVWKADRINP